MARGEYCVYADVDLREERRVARQERELNLIEPDDEWIDTASVGRLLGRSTAKSMYWQTRLIKPVVRTRSRSRTARTGKAVGWLWNRADLEMLIRVMRECRVTTAVAVRIVRAMRDGRI